MIDCEIPLARVPTTSVPTTGADTQRTRFDIPGLDCSEELGLIQKGLKGLPGIGDVSADYLNRALWVKHDTAALSAEAISRRLTEIGFAPVAKPISSTATNELGQLPIVSAPVPAGVAPLRTSATLGGVLLLVAGGLAIFSASLSVPGFSMPAWAIGAVATLSVLLSGWPVAIAAWRSIRLRRLDMNALMTIAAVGGLATGEWLEAAATMFLFAVSLWLERYSLDRARRAVETLVQVFPAVAHRLKRAEAEHVCNHEHEHSHDHDAEQTDELTDIHPNEIQTGDLLLVKPGERVPVDGLVEAGVSQVNQSPLTGESMPVEKSPGEQVLAGSLNGDGALTIRAARPANESTLAHVARLVEQAQSSRAPTERFVDQFARWYTPAVILAALLLVFVPIALGNFGYEWFAQIGWREWLHRGLVLLVVACPCALVISTPVTLVCGLNRAARRGILIKGGGHLEQAALVDAIAFDKTGTLTRGEPRVMRIEILDDNREDEVLTIAAALEAKSEHPLAKGIVAAASERGLKLPISEEVQAIPGAGVTGKINGQACAVVSERHYRQQHRDIPPTDSSAANMTSAVVIVEGKRIGTLWLADEPRGDAAVAVAKLKQLGIKRIAMLTGDSRGEAARIAEKLQLNEVYAELMPADKLQKVGELVDESKSLAMIGDGVNDAPALAAASVGVALGQRSSDTALETADVVIISPHVGRVVEWIEIGRMTRRRLWENITLSLAGKSLVLLLAVWGLAGMWLAVAADVGLSLLVIANGMRLLRLANTE